MSRATVADTVSPLLRHLLGPEPAVRVRAWDGSTYGPAGAPTLVLRSRRALRRLVWHPDELGFGRAFVAGDLDVEGDIADLFTAYGAATRARSQGRWGEADVRRRDLLGAAVRLGALGPQPAPPPEELHGRRRLRGRLHSRSRDRAAVSHHYDVGNDFYRGVLGPSLAYSCAYWTRPDDPAYGVDDAQRDKLELVCRKLGLTAGARLLDVGCGWGSLVLHAAREHGVTAVGVTVSEQQAELARKRVAEAGLADRVEIRAQDYRDVDDGPYDAIASVGMAEHVGSAQYGAYASGLHRLLREGGRLLNHQISRPPGPVTTGPSFVSAYVFPDGELQTLGATVSALAEAGFEIRDVEALREHYGRTLRAWTANLETAWPAAVAATSLGRARVWRLYLAGSAVAFESGRLGVDQVLAVKPYADGRASMPGAAIGAPATRAGWAVLS